MMEYNQEKFIEGIKNPKTRKETFALVVEQYSERLYWQIRKMVYNHDDANDILQNVFLKAWSNLKDFRGDAKLTTWLYRIAINEALTFIKKEKIRNSIPLDGDDVFLLNQLESDPFFDGDQAEILFQKALLSLPEKQRLVFQMKYFEEMKYEEISDITGTSVGGLKASYHHAVKKIEKFIQEEG